MFWLSLLAATHQRPVLPGSPRGVVEESGNAGRENHVRNGVVRNRNAVCLEKANVFLVQPDAVRSNHFERLEVPTERRRQSDPFRASSRMGDFLTDLVKVNMQAPDSMSQLTVARISSVRGRRTVASPTRKRVRRDPAAAIASVMLGEHEIERTWIRLARRTKGDAAQTETIQRLDDARRRRL